MSDLRPGYEKLVGFIEESKKGVSIDFKEMFAVNRDLFSLLQETLEKGSEDEKEKALAIYRDFLVFLLKEGGSGLAEFSKKDMSSLGGHPEAFTADQWRVIQGIQETMGK